MKNRGPTPGEEPTHDSEDPVSTARKKERNRRVSYNFKVLSHLLLTEPGRDGQHWTRPTASQSLSGRTTLGGRARGC